MSIFSKLFAALKKIISKIVGFIGKILKKIWPLLLALVVIYFAPAIAGWLTSAGAPGWLSGAFNWVGTTVTPYLASAGEWLMSAGSTVFAGASAVWSSLSMGTKAAVVLGAATLLAPEEVGALVSELGTVVGDTIGAVAGGFLSSPVGIAVLAGAAYFLLSRNSSGGTMIYATADGNDPANKGDQLWQN